MPKPILYDQTSGGVSAVPAPAGAPTKIKVKIGDEDREVPVSYLEGDPIRCGRYTHPETGQLIEVTPERIDRWIVNLGSMRTAGIEPHVPLGHSSQPDKNLGFIYSGRRDGDTLRLTYQLIGEDAVMTALRNRASLRVVPEFKGPDGRTWSDAIEHCAFTPVPVIGGQSGARAIAASRDEGDVFQLSTTPTGVTIMPATLTDEQFAQIKTLIGGGDDITPENIGAKLIDWLAGSEQMPAGEGVAAIAASRSRPALIKFVKDQFELAKTKANEAAELARRVIPNLPDGHTLSLLNRSYQTERGAAVEAGGVSPAVADELDKIFKPGGKLSPIALARGGDGDGDGSDGPGEALAFAVWQILRQNKPVAGGVRTGVQQLGRATPGDQQPAEDEEMKRVRESAKKFGETRNRRQAANSR